MTTCKCGKEMKKKKDDPQCVITNEGTVVFEMCSHGVVVINNLPDIDQEDTWEKLEVK